jgi:arsenate reductase-like glutaredoxin family protein
MNVNKNNVFLNLFLKSNNFANEINVDTNKQAREKLIEMYEKIDQELRDLFSNNKDGYIL